ncbi:uncharacterized protein EDB91DRAFT_1088956 [Suillus paluster]|uniref:uncharacterized protein n=1 Tax=Suillus paluster TaxID=48578 RepID=UPI001B886490|nr:uncharacterized protein EDB91DRAFT_1088956 [Suillus paluster]KAG1720116.1 hypothetical protein EDB91DRAFT_1088956 [Suillus paluster]
MVLGTDFWPLRAPDSNFIIPPEIFFYQTRHFSRKLIWLWNYSTTELGMNYFNQKYTLMTSSYQMAVLLQYNAHDTLSSEELITATAISKEILLQVLASLVKAKILINENIYQYDLNPNFKFKKIHVPLNQPLKAEVKAESLEVLKAVGEDRKYVIQETIVRIMKARKTIKNRALFQEVISHLSQRFAPNIPDIKKNVG